MFFIDQHMLMPSSDVENNKKRTATKEKSFSLLQSNAQKMRENPEVLLK